MLKRFAQTHHYVTETELLEYNAFVQMLPGASSTQIISLIGYKRGGAWLAIATLIVWVLPAGLFMTAISFLLNFIDKRSLETDIFRFIQPMAVGYIGYAAIRIGRIAVKNLITLIIAVVSSMLCFLLFKSPWVFPVVIVIAGVCTNFSKKRIPEMASGKRSIHWSNVWLFVTLFVLIGASSAWSRKQQNKLGEIRPIHRFWNLSENFYRFGSIVFGGGDVLVPLMYEQFVTRPKPAQRYMTSEEFLTGSGLVRALPGPVFSVAAFHGGMAMRQWGAGWQTLGCAAGLIFIFLPSALFVLFFFPIWQYLKRYAIIYRSLEGINAAIVGIMVASSFYLLRDISLVSWKVSSVLNLSVIAGTVLVLLFTRLPSPMVVLLCLLLGYIF